VDEPPQDYTEGKFNMYKLDLHLFF